MLNESESKHLSQVLRLKVNDLVSVIDGRGSEWLGVVQLLNKKGTQIKINNVQRQANGIPLCSIAICPTKNIDRFEFFLEKATEIGISNIYPILTQRSERKTINNERLEKIILNATKQSGNLYLPSLSPLMNFNDFLEKIKELNFTFKGLGHCMEREKRKSISDVYVRGHNALFVVGPEGDFTLNEIELACQNGFEPIVLGDSRLRVETAGIIACSQINFINYAL